MPIASGGPELVQLTVGRLQMRETSGRFIETKCSLLPAVVQYEVVFEEGRVTLPRSSGQGAVVALANNTSPPSASIKNLPLTTYGLDVDMHICLDQNATVERQAGDESPWAINLDSWTANAEVWKYLDWNAPLEYTSFVDPTDDIIFAFNKYMLRGASLAASWSNASQLIDEGLSTHQTVSGWTRPIVYHSDLRWYVGAAILELLTILVILPLFWGWWTLECDTSLSPLNIALAFQSPILRDVDPASGARGVVEKLGHRKIRLGVIERVEHIDADTKRAVGGHTSSSL